MIKLDKIAFNASVFEGSPLYASNIATSVTVIDKSTDTLASLWSDRDGLIVKSNPFNLEEPGVIEFYADSGRYDIVAVNGPNARTWSDYILGSEGGVGSVESITAGDGVDVDSSDPASPIVSSDFNAISSGIDIDIDETHNNSWIDASSNITITLPDESTLDLGSKFVAVISNLSSGDISIVGETVGVTILFPDFFGASIPPNSTVGIKKTTALNTYIIFGSMGV